ncbi:MAG TPA: alpha-glucan family phosphorylase [Puia sp.]|uniref:alpha-glucan family phosphorylase n=1 Tax=Puia sp. TaxID=2045100 RepID=UPI002C1A72E3|nr:alpha-glucan family phosphorylase [Puia sp.]HVU96834.1 alpha-glucan family phosphorylase [Puia sp.]
MILYNDMPDLPGLDSLEMLALDVRWCWNHAADELWRQLNPELWDLTHNPWVVLQTISRDQFKRCLADSDFRQMMDKIIQSEKEAASGSAWFQQQYPDTPLTCVAYFSMEFMLSEALPIYVGGLGNVAGDQLKTASDLGVPVIGVGLLYQQGYFRQEIDRDGRQQALFPYNDPGQLPIKPLRREDGEWLRLKISLSGDVVWLRTWEVRIGRTKLYLLDSNDPANAPVHRGITGEMYSGGPEMRIKQELILGIGGWRLLEAIGIDPEVCHLNEGHAAFLVLERARSYMKKTGHLFEVALATTRAGNLFTTHTAVAAGFDYFNPSLIGQFLGIYAKDELGVSLHDLLALGRRDADDSAEYFNMAYLAIRGSMAVNGVSRLHGKVSKTLFQSLFPRWPEHEVPVGYVTNGVHMPSWDSKYADQLWTETCGKGRWVGDTEKLCHHMCCLSDESIWQMRSDARKELIKHIRGRVARQLTSSEGSPASEGFAKKLFDHATLTLGFARRFATYKRPNLLLQDPGRLIKILTNTDQPVQLLIAGKASPADREGQALIRDWVQFINNHNLHGHIAFLSDYDMLLAEQLVQGVDVWINSPRRPWEACGTSGMKVLVNGGLNISELDGWWAEAYDPSVGWALGDGLDHGNDSSRDAVEAQSLYDLLEQEVIPSFYARDDKGIPVSWVAKIRESMSRLTVQYSANRAVREYVERYYLPAARAYHERTAGNGTGAVQIVDRLHELEHKWTGIRIEAPAVQSDDRIHHFTAAVFLNGLDPNTVSVELYADGVDGAGALREKMLADDPQGMPAQLFIYRASVPASRPASDFTVRVIPGYGDIRVPLESNRILWQR